MRDNTFLKKIACSLSSFILDHKGKLTESHIKNSDLPGFLKKYLSSNPDIQNELLELVLLSQDKPNRFANTQLAKVVADFLTHAMPYLLVKLPSNFILLSDSDKESIIEALDLKSNLKSYLADLFTHRTKQMVLADVAFLLKNIGADFIQVRVQMASEANSDLKTEIYKTLQKQYPNALITFQVERKLIGGMRVIADGKMYDFSWTQKIKNLVKLI